MIKYFQNLSVLNKIQQPNSKLYIYMAVFPKTVYKFEWLDLFQGFGEKESKNK